MLSLFNIEGQRAKPTAHALLVSPFKEIWEADETVTKADAIMNFTYIEFMISPLKTNPFAGYGDEERHIKIIEAFKLPDYVPSELVKEGLEALKKMMFDSSYSMRFLDSGRAAIEKIQVYLETVDLQEKNERGQLVHKPQDILRTVSQMNEAIKTLAQLEAQVIQELYDAQKTKSNAEINPFEELIRTE